MIASSGAGESSGQVLKESFFFYGTLMDSDVLARVIGRPHRSIKTFRADAAGWRAVQGRGVTYPFLIADAICHTEGVVISGITPHELRRLKRFEGNEYAVGRVTVTIEGVGQVASRAFLPRFRNMPWCKVPWSIDVWRRRHKRGFMACLADHGVYG